MYKKRNLLVILGLVAILIIAALLIIRPTFLGFVTYDGATNILCGSNVYESSTLSVDFTVSDAGSCDSGFSGFDDNGAVINTSGVTLDCQGHQIQGDGGGASVYGIQTIASNDIIQSCISWGFKNNINISSSGVKVIDSVMNFDSAGTYNIWLAAGLSATLINTSFTPAKVQVGAGSNLYAQYYYLINVTNATGAVSGASVQIYNETAGSTNVIGTTDAQGLYRVNLTDKAYAAGTGTSTNFFYYINASKDVQNGTNLSYDVLTGTSVQTINIFISGSASAVVPTPYVDIISPANQNYTNSSVPVNISSNGTSVWFNNGTTNISYVLGNYIFPQGTNTLTAYANNTNNVVNSSSVNFFVDSIAPDVVITGPSGTYTTSSVTINITISEVGTCLYKITGDSTNASLNTTNNLTFTGSRTGLANGVYTLNVYCNDSYGNRNDSVSGSFTISVSSVVPPSGGGGVPCVVGNNWEIGSWKECVNGVQFRTDISNCGTTRIVNQSCGNCTNECDSIGTTCNGNTLETCDFVDGCYKITNSRECGTSTSCLSGRCVTNLENKENNVPGIAINRDMFRPSNYIHLADVPPVVVDTGVGIIIFGGVGWFFWLKFLALLLPLLALKLKHYSVSAIDYKGVFNSTKGISGDKLFEFMQLLERNYGWIVYAGNRENIMKYHVDKGFIELSSDSPLMITGHFSNSRDADKFGVALRKTFDSFGEKEINIYRVVEKASIIGAWRAYMRARKTRKEIRRLFKK